MLKKCRGPLHDNPVYLPYSKFYVSKSTKDGYSPYCIACEKRKVNDRRKQEQEAYRKEVQTEREIMLASRYNKKLAAVARSQRNRSCEGRLLKSTRQNALAKGLPHNLTIDDIVIPDYCPILHIKLDVTKTGYDRENTPSVDRIFPEKGYVKGNVQVISGRANRMKTNANFAEMVLLGKWAQNQITLYTTQEDDEGV